MREGSKGLSRGNWPLLQQLDLRKNKGFNKLGEKGLAHISKAKWVLLKDLKLSINVVS